MSKEPQSEETVVIGGATLHRGDCFSLLDSLPESDILLTDPPYGIGFAAQPTDYQRAAGMKPREWDSAPVGSLDPLRAKCRTQIIWGGNYYALPPSRGWLCWYKPDAPPSMSDFELAWTNMDKTMQIFCKTVKSSSLEKDYPRHPTQKPTGLMEWCLSQAGGMTVLDPFMGSGTTGVACIQMGKPFVGVEIDPEYFAMAVKRIRAAHAQLRLFA